MTRGQWGVRGTKGGYMAFRKFVEGRGKAGS